VIYYSNKALSSQRPFHKSVENPSDQNKESWNLDQDKESTHRRSFARFVESNVCSQATYLAQYKEDFVRNEDGIGKSWPFKHTMLKLAVKGGGGWQSRGVTN
jgi:hypothetical protein